MLLNAETNNRQETLKREDMFNSANTLTLNTPNTSKPLNMPTRVSTCEKNDESTPDPSELESCSACIGMTETGESNHVRNQVQVAL